MFLILPVQTLLLYTTVGVSTYSLVLWLLSLHPMEMMYYISLISTLTSIGCVAVMISLINILESKSHDDKCSCSHRVVVEKDGTLMITTLSNSESSEGSECSEEETENETEEIRERLEKEEPLPSPVEETTEFAELLKE